MIVTNKYKLINAVISHETDYSIFYVLYENVNER